jgi:large subunit ribosomal protein L4
MKIDILNSKGEKTGRSIELADDIFGIKPNDHVVYLAVKAYLANQRQGTHKAKEKNEVARTTRKFKRQKGTGGARAGSLKNPMFKGGGRAFGPRPHDYYQKVNKKVKLLARRSALSSKAMGGNLIVVEEIQMEKPRTKDFVDVLKNLQIENNKSLFVTSEANTNLYLSGRNLKNTRLVRAQDLNTYDILKSQKLVLSEQSVEWITNSLKN